MAFWVIIGQVSPNTFLFRAGLCVSIYCDCDRSDHQLQRQRRVIAHQHIDTQRHTATILMIIQNGALSRDGDYYISRSSWNITCSSRAPRSDARSASWPFIIFFSVLSRLVPSWHKSGWTRGRATKAKYILRMTRCRQESQHSAMR